MKRILLILFILFAACSAQPTGNLDSFANCLADNDVNLYGAYWCHNCEIQKSMFGDSVEILKSRGVYVECDPKCSGELPKACDGVYGSPELCISNEIEGYPTWVFKNGERIVGTASLEEISEKSGCSLND